MAESALKSKGETSEAPPLTVDTVVWALHGVRDWKEFGKWLFFWSSISDRDARLETIDQQYGSDGNYLHGVVEQWFKGHRQSWRLVILALGWAKEITVADCIRGYAEPSRDPTLTRDRVAAVMDVTKSLKRVTDYLAVPEHMVDHLSEREKKHAVGNYYLQTHPDASWENLTKGLYCAKEYSAVELTKQHLPKVDPTLTASNMLSVLSGMEEQWEELGRRLDVWQSKIDELRQHHRSSTDRMEALTTFIIRYHFAPSWQHIASALQEMGLQDLADVVTTKYVRARSQQIFDEAMKHGHIESRNIKALIFGAAGTGKSHTLALIMDEEPPKLRRSTPCATRPVRAVSRSRIERKGKKWVRLTPDDFSDTIADTATEFPSVIQSTSETTQAANASNIPASAASPKAQTDPTKTHSSSLTTEMSSEPILSVEEQLLKRIEQSPYARHVKKAFERDRISLIDTGGQPQFHEVLPMFMRGTSAFMFVIRLDESLSDHPLIEYYDKEGNLVGTPYHSPYTNQQILMQCMRVMQSQASQSEDGQCANPIFVGTHRDLEHHCEETREEKNRKIHEMLPPAVKAEAIYCGEDMKQLIFPVNAKTPEPEDKEVASELRNVVVKRSLVKPKKIPLRWHALELALQKLMHELGRGVLSKTECLAVARRFHFDHESFEEALQYLDQLNILFYYKDVLPDVIFCNPQILLDKITELVEYNYHLRTDPSQGRATPGKLLRFRDQGVVTLDFLKQEGFARHYVPDLFTAVELLKLFKKLLIVSQVTKEEYLMPCLLPVADQPSLLAPCSSIPSLLLYFPHSPLVGVFCALIAYLLSEAKWELVCDPDTQSPSKVDRNTVHFRVPGDLPGMVILTDSFSTYFQVSIQLPQNDPFELCSKVCPQIRETIRAGLRKASSTLNYNNSVPRDAFLCEEHTQSTSRHASVVRSDCTLMTCTVNPAQVYSNLSKQHLLWFGHQSPTASGVPLDLSGMSLAEPEENYLSEEDLIDITDYLLPLEKTHIYNLGLVLGISQHKTKAMMDSTTFLDDVIAAWLRREDQVKKKGEPSWTVLVRALEHPRVGQCGISQKIRKEKALH